MSQKQSLLNSEQGFTLLEILVAGTLGLLILALIMSTTLLHRNVFVDDVVRMRIAQNLRSGMDVVSINVRQAGESLGGSFPAVMITDGGEGAPDTLVLRRNLIQEVHTLCEASVAGADRLYVSAATLIDSACVGTNVEPLANVWSAYRTGQGSEVSIFIWDRAQRVGEFATYTGEGRTNSADGRRFFLRVDDLENNYSALTTSIYILEEFQFFLDADSRTLLLRRDNLDETQAVAFDVTDFQLEVRMRDGEQFSSLSPDDEYQWKDIRNVVITMQGVAELKDRTVTKSISGSFFPRNVLSVEQF